MIKASGTITLTRVNDGATGATGNGVSSIVTEHYLSSSKTSLTGGSWSTTPPTWSTGKYIWKRFKTVYTNGTTSYTTPLCDSSWEAVNELQLGSRNLILNSDTLSKYCSVVQTYRATVAEVEDPSAFSKKHTEVKCITAGMGFHLPVFTRNADRVGKKYTWSLWIKCSANKSGNIGHEGGGTKNVSISTEWKQFTHTWTMNNGTYTSFTFYLGFLASEILYIRDFIIVEGVKPFPWTPAPEDVDARITTEIKTVSDKQASFDVLLDGITGKISKTESQISTVKTDLGVVKSTAEKAKSDLSALTLDLNGFKTSVGSTYSSKQDLVNAKKEVLDASATDAQKKADKAKTDAITSANTNTTTALKSYMTTTQTNTAIKQANDNIKLSVDQSTNLLLNFDANMFNDCVKCLKKTTSETTVKKLQDMPIGIDITTLRNRDICISVDVVATSVTMKSLGNFAGAWFTVTYTDNTTKTYKAVFVPGAIYLENTLSGITKSINQRLYATYRIDDKVVKSVSMLALEINLNGNIMVANPKVEFGVAPSGLEFSQKNQELRLQKTEFLLTPTEITALVNERIGADGELKTMKFVLNKDGGEFYDGALSIFNKANEKVFYADTNGNLTIKNLTAVDGNFSGTINGSTIIGGTITGGSISGVTMRTDHNIFVGASIYMLDEGDKYDSRSIVMKNGWISYNGILNNNLYGIDITAHNDDLTNTAVIDISTSNSLSSIYLAAKRGSNINRLIVTDGGASTSKNFTVEGILTVYGAKHRLIKDSLEGNILMNAVESTEAVFEDYGTATLNKEGKCVIRLNKRFLSTVNAKELYYVFLTKLGEGDLFVKSKYNFAFIVHGTPNLKFDWRITAKQRDYENVRMDEYVKEKS